jgi:hypothetical protein
MHTTTQRKRGLKDGVIETLVITLPQRGNLFNIATQIAQAAMADKRNIRRKMKAARKARNWKGD